MMNKSRNVTIEVYKGDPEDISTDNLAGSFIKALAEMIEKVPDKYRESVTIAFSSECEGYAAMEAYYSRPETKKEVSHRAGITAARVKRELVAARNDVALYERQLKALKVGDEL